MPLPNISEHSRQTLMGINIGICETEAPSAPCRELRGKIVKVHVDDTAGLEDYLEYDVKVDLDTAKGAVGDWESFLKRNRINPETDAVYMDKVKKDGDRAILEPLAERICTGWIAMDGLPDDVRKDVLSRAGKDDILTGWDMLDFDEMGEMCLNCPLSWDKGRGCIGAFGPDNSLLPEIADRHGCPIVASAPRSAAEGKRFTSEDAKELLREVDVLREALPAEGKMMVRRYSGPVDRMEAVAKISVSEGCGFFFF